MTKRLSEILKEVRAIYADGLLDRALERVKQSLLDYPSSGLLWLLRSDIESALGSVTAALESREQAYGLSPLLMESAPEKASQPICSIIIPVFNKVEYTERCLEALIANTAGHAYEVVIVDNASTDGTKELLASLEGDVRVISNAQNLGFAKACNQGAALATGKYLLFLNNDTEACSGWLSPLLDVLETEPDVAAVGSKLLFPDGSLQHAGVEVLENQANQLPLDFRHRYYRLPSDHPDANLQAEVQVVTGAAMLVRRERFFEVGGFDEGFWNGNEDVDLCLKLREKGYRIVYEPKSCLIHHESVSGPERWSKVNENISRLLERWVGKVIPEFLLTPGGEVVPHPLRLSPSVEAIPQASLTSIILLAYNQLTFTKLCIESVLANTDAPFELILVDNGSTDGTGEYFRALQTQDERVRVILNPKNQGFALGCNQGAALARGEFVLFLNNDTLVPRGWLGRLQAHFERASDLGAVGAVSNCVSGPQQLPSVPVENHPEAFSAIMAFADQVAQEKAGQGFELGRLVGFCLMLRRSVLDLIGGFDSQFGIGNFEDDDFCLRIQAAGFRTWVAQDVYVHHFGSRTFAALGAAAYSGTIEEGWRRFKVKWGLPESLEREQGYQLKLPSFDLNRHHVALPSPSDATLFAAPSPFGPGTRGRILDERKGTVFFHHPDWSSSAWREILTAYVRTYSSEDDVSLMFWLDPSQGVSQESVAERIVDHVTALEVAHASMPDLLLVPDVLDLEGLAGLYAAADIIVPHGDTLQAARARLAGKPLLENVSSEAWREAFAAQRKPLSL